MFPLRAFHRLSLISCFVFLLTATALLGGCASTQFNKGLTENGEKVYLVAPPSQNMSSVQTYVVSQKNEVDKLNYLMNRIKEAKDAVFIRDGREYNWLQAYRGGNFMMRKYYKGGDALEFIRDFIWKSRESGKPHLVRLPDGSIHIGYYIILNELEALETLFKSQEALT